MKILAICGSPRRGDTYSALNNIKEEYPNIDFKESVVEMYGFFGWKGQRVHVGQGVGNMSTGVGGSSLDYWGMSPQPQNFAIDEWHPLLRNDMFGSEVDPYTGYYVPIRHYNWIDERVPIDRRQLP